MVKSEDELINELLTRGVENIYPSREYLAARLAKGERLTVYLGIDPTAPTLHIGHAISLAKLSLFQKLGHQVILLIGDFTATIGDPDKLSVRAPLTREQVLENAKLYKQQAETFLSFEGDNPAILKYNSEWLGKLSFADTLELMSHVSHAQLVKRDMFQKRIDEEKELYMHEFMYPIMQGYDSVVMDVDGEVGGNDQTFNMLVGRDLLKKLKNKEKFVISCKLLADAEGVKMGKTTGNMVALTDSPEEMFGKVMSWTDSMIIPGFELCTDIPMSEIEGYAADMEAGANPRDLKMKLAHAIVARYTGQEGADRGQEYFAATIQKKEIPDEIPEASAAAGEQLREVLLRENIIESKSDFARLIKEGAITVHVNNEEIKISELQFAVAQDMVVKVGKRRFLKITVS